jgi:hypothetical protein
MKGTGGTDVEVVGCCNKNEPPGEVVLMSPVRTTAARPGIGPKSSRSGGAAILLIIILAVVCLAVGVLAAVAVGGNLHPAPTPAPAPIEITGGGGGGLSTGLAPRQYTWLKRDQDNIIVASLGGSGASTAAATGNTTTTETPPTTTTPATTTSPTTGSTDDTGQGPTPASIAPDVVGKSLEEAGDLLGQQGLRLVMKSKRYSDVAAGRIASQWPDPGATVSDGTVYVSKSLGARPAPKPKPRRTSTRRRSGSRSGGCSAPCGRCHPGR